VEIIATLCAENANSYITVADADLYFAARLNAGAWETASVGDKEKALVTACRHIETCRLRVERRGLELTSPVIATQALSFPRLRDVNALGTYIIPERVLQAQCEEALALLAFGADQARRAALQAGGVSGFSTDGLSESYREGAGSHPLISAEARQLLMPFLQATGVIATSENPAGEFTVGSGR
jgi:hypothetical protein